MKKKLERQLSLAPHLLNDGLLNNKGKQHLVQTSNLPKKKASLFLFDAQDIRSRAKPR